MKLFLTHSYFYQLDPKQWKNKTPYPPLGTITALAHLKAKEKNVCFFDPALDPDTNTCNRAMDSYNPDIVIIYEDGFNYLTKMCLTNMREACFEMLRNARKLGAKTIVSSSDATDHFELYHQNGADFILHGEGEQTLSELVDVLETDSAEFEAISGLSFRTRDEAIIRTAPRANLKDLDVLPSAAWEAIDLDKYRKIWNQGKYPFTLNVSTTRGCPFKCNWCAKPIYGNRYHARSPERVVEELAFLVRSAGVTHFWMTDDIFGLKPGWVKRFRELIEAKQLHIHYKIQSRADLLLEDTNIEDLATSGLEEAWIGAESGSQKILDAMDKGITLAQINEATTLLQSKGVRVAYFLQFGYLGEQQEDVLKTLEMVAKNEPDDIGISVSYPLPGTGFFETVKAQLGTKTNWTDSDDLDLMFQGTYSRETYRDLQRYVHHRFRAAQGREKWKGNKPAVAWRTAFLLPYNLVMTRLKKPKLG